MLMLAVTKVCNVWSKISASDFISHSQFLHLSDFPLLDTVIYKSLFSAMRFHYSEIWSTIRLQSGLIEHEDSTCLSTSLKVKLMFLSIELLLVALRACDGTTRQ